MKKIHGDTFNHQNYIMIGHNKTACYRITLYHQDGVRCEN